MYTRSRSTEEMLAAARQIGPAEAAKIYQEANYKKYGVVAALKTTPEGFEMYLQRRAAADRRAKTGR